MKVRTISEASWEGKYRPRNAPDGSLSWAWDELPVGIDVHKVWSWADGDENGATLVLPGYHVVNVYAYAVTEVPWDDAGLIVEFGDSEAERAIEEIALILWYDPETKTWDRNKEWDSDTMTQVANVLTDRGFGPEPEAGWFENAEDTV